MLRFNVLSDGKFHDNVLFPNWADDAILYRLRVNVPPGSTIDVAGIRVAAYATGPGVRWRALVSDARIVVDSDVERRRGRVALIPCQRPSFWYLRD